MPPSLRVLNRTQRDPFRKSVVWQRSGLLRLVAARAGSVAASSFFLRPLPAIGRSNDRWHRSAVGLACFFLAVVPLIAGAYPVRDCVSAPPSKRSPGGGVMTDHGANSRPNSFCARRRSAHGMLAATARTRS